MMSFGIGLSATYSNYNGDQIIGNGLLKGSGRKQIIKGKDKRFINYHNLNMEDNATTIPFKLPSLNFGVSTGSAGQGTPQLKGILSK